jgi:hypothetical protein
MNTNKCLLQNHKKDFHTSIPLKAQAMMNPFCSHAHLQVIYITPSTHRASRFVIIVLSFLAKAPSFLLDVGLVMETSPSSECTGEADVWLATVPVVTGWTSLRVH